MHPFLMEEMARQRQAELERSLRRNAADPRARALGAGSDNPAAWRRAMGKGFVRAGLALLGGGAALRFSDEESAPAR